MMSPTYHRRGRKTFFILLVLRLMPAIFFLFGLIVLAGIEDQLASIIRTSVTHNAEALVQGITYIISGGFIVFLFLCFMMVLVALIQYISIEYTLDDTAFKTRIGIINISETSILYRQIQSVEIERPLIYRILGVSRIVILTSAEDNTATPEKNESETIIDLLDVVEAERLQHEMLAQGHTQEVRHVDITTERTS